MLKSGAALIAGMMLVIGLAGCGASVQADGVGQSSSKPSATSTPVESESPATPAAAPIESKPAPADSAHPEWGDLSQEEFFLASLKDTWQTSEPSVDDQLAAGRYVCEQLAAGVARADIIAVTGDSDAAKSDNAGLIGTSIYVLCPEFEG